MKDRIKRLSKKNFTELPILKEHWETVRDTPNEKDAIDNLIEYLKR